VVSDLREQLEGIEGVLKLMTQYNVQELAWDGLVLKRSAHRPTVAMDLQKVMEEHTKPLPEAPWDAIPQEAVDAWAEGGKTT
jgi:hypothetical protein